MGFIKKKETYKINMWLERCDIRNQLMQQGCPECDVVEFANEFYNKEFDVEFTIGKESITDFKLIVTDGD